MCVLYDELMTSPECIPASHLVTAKVDIIKLMWNKSETRKMGGSSTRRPHGRSLSVFACILAPLLSAIKIPGSFPVCAPFPKLTPNQEFRHV